jgi:hypothetical protein
VAVAVTAIASLAGLAGILSYRIDVLERKARIQRDETEEARALEGEARALEAAGAIRLSELRADTVLRALRASSRIAGAAGVFTVKARQPAAVLLGRTPDLAPLQDAVTEVSLALDEIRLLGPAAVAEAMGTYFDTVMDVHEAATSKGPDAQQSVMAKGEAMFEAKAALVAAAQAAGIGGSEN